MSSYLGVPPQSGFITTAKQRVTSSTNNYVDLDHSISSLADVIVFVNFVKQDYTNLTLTTSSRITLGGTLVSSDIVEIAYLGKAVATQTPSSGTVTNDMLAGSIANSKLANSSITLNGSAVSLGGSASTGKILQVVTNPVADTSADTVDTGSWEAIPLSVALTPSATSSKINVSASVHYEINAINTGFSLNIYRDIGGGGYSQIRDLNSFRISKSGYAEQERLGFWSYSTTFSPSTTSAVTFKLYGITGGSAVINLKTLDLTAMEIGV